MQKSPDTASTPQPVMTAEQVTEYVRKVFPQADGFRWRVDALDAGTMIVGFS